ncbi:MAG: hypothetical protein CL468_04500 [Acidimicrobiaceae bacterium]|nr:hypothetical protein [Acidimicrobiaceae bacterium]|tara:strand:+ start:2124 stop:3245 length:1122 start_codon:yes stop_codon:yes gene_type:complete
MSKVVILGGGLHPFGRYPEKSFRELTRVAISNCLDDAGVQFSAIQAAFCGRVYAPMGTGLEVITQFGETGIPIINIEQACSSSSTAFRQAVWAIEQGIYDLVLVVGFEKMERGPVEIAASDSYDLRMGQSLAPANYGLKSQIYMDRYGATAEQFAAVSVKSHANAKLNPYAQYRKEVTIQEVMESRMIATPITLLQCSPTSDGASAVILSSATKARQYRNTHGEVYVTGWACGTDSYGDDDSDELEPCVTRLSNELYERAAIGPEDIDVVQLHDAFAPAEIIRMEAMGLAPEGSGARFVSEGKTGIDGPVPINTDGGLISRGHPMGATGLAQIIEILRQLRQEAGPRQVQGAPKIGVCHNSGVGGINMHSFSR